MSATARALMNSIGLMIMGVVCTFVATWYWTTKAKREKAHSELVAEVTAMKTQLALVGQTILPLSAAFQAVLIKQLTHFHTPEMDALMRKLGPPYTLTEGDEERLAVLLEERALDMGDKIDASERDAAHMLPMVMRRVKADSALVTTVTPQLQFVAVPIREED